MTPCKLFAAHWHSAHQDSYLFCYASKELWMAMEPFFLNVKMQQLTNAFKSYTMSGFLFSNPKLSEKTNSIWQGACFFKKRTE